MLLIYNLVTWFYYLFIRTVSPFHHKAEKLYKGQKSSTTQLRSFFDEADTKVVIWIHTASLGEFEQGRPLIEMLRIKYPQASILLTFFSPSGYEVQKNYDKADIVTYLPFDTASNARTLVEIVKPSLAIFVKYEFWYHYSRALFERNIPLLSISTIFKPDQPFFKWYGSLHRAMLRRFSYFFVQNEASLQLLKSININAAKISGDTRYDRVKDVANKPPLIAVVEKFLNGAKPIVIGSSWPSDMSLILNGLTKLIESHKLIIAPHNIDEKSINELLGIFPQARLFSKSDESSISLADANVLIIDNIGMLSQLYGYASVVYVGGGARGALHNTLEPATWGKPVLFAKHGKNRKFQEAMDLVENKAAFEISNGEEFNKRLTELIKNDELRTTTGRNARKQVEENAGATEIIIRHIQPMLDD